MKKTLKFLVLTFISGSLFSQTGFINSDFEASTPGSVSSPTQVQGWTVTATHHPSSGPAGNTCNLITYSNWGSPTLSAVMSTSFGFVDNTIGPVYPVFSVFGSGPGNTLAASYNPSLSVNMRGTNFFRLNSEINGTFQIEKLSKTMLISPGNDVLELAYMFVFYPGHQCCDAPALNVFVNGNSCAFLQNTCQTASSTVFYEAGSGQPANPNSYSAVFSKWRLQPVDLSLYMGQSVTVDIIAAHCTAGGHAGYAYIDARAGSSAMVNGNSASISSSGGTVSSCVPTATISAPPGYLNYQWNGPGGFFSNSSVISASVVGAYSLSAAGTTSCSTIHKVFNLVYQQAALQTSMSVPLPCPGDPVILSANGATSYSWNTGATTSTLQVSPLATTVYSVWGTTGSCQSFGTQTVIVGQGPPLYISTSAPALCLGDSATLLAFGASSFTWNTGAKNPSIVISPLTTTPYFVSGSNGGCVSTTSITQVVQNCTGLKTEAAQPDVRFFPNPVNELLTVECVSPVELRIFNQLGSLVYKGNLALGENRIRFVELNTGVYLAEVRTQGATRIVKIVKQ